MRASARVSLFWLPFAVGALDLLLEQPLEDILHVGVEPLLEQRPQQRDRGLVDQAFERPSKASFRLAALSMPGLSRRRLVACPLGGTRRGNRRLAAPGRAQPLLEQIRERHLCWRSPHAPGKQGVFAVGHVPRNVQCLQPSAAAGEEAETRLNALRIRPAPCLRGQLRPHHAQAGTAMVPPSTTSGRWPRQSADCPRRAGAMQPCAGCACARAFPNRCGIRWGWRCRSAAGGDRRVSPAPDGRAPAARKRRHAPGQAASRRGCA